MQEKQNEKELTWERYSEMVLQSLRHNEEGIKETNKQLKSNTDELYTHINKIKDDLKDAEILAETRYGDFRVLKNKIRIQSAVIGSIPAIIMGLIWIITKLIE